MQTNRLFPALTRLTLWVLLAGSAVLWPARMTAETGTSPLKGRVKDTPVYAIQSAFNDIYGLYKNRVVFISTERTIERDSSAFNDPLLRRFFGPGTEVPPGSQKQTGLGTGIVISADGYVVTNQHVLAGADKVQVRLDAKVYDAQVVGADELSDIGLLRILKLDHPLEPAYLGDSDRIKVGDWAIAIGNPFGLDRTFTVGVISAVGRQDLDGPFGSFIQTDASINPGNSGGPLLNLDGEVIGINRMIYSQTGGSMGIGFAIPINNARAIIEELKSNGKIRRGFVGLQLAPLTQDFARELGVPDGKGALVGSVIPQSPAATAGLKERDVVVKVDDKPIASAEELVRLVAGTKVGTTLKFGVIRAKAPLNLFVTVKERP